ncbi:MAG: spermine/spermidine synthase domain-containing protein [Aggregatilineales bacterium]
MIARLNQLPPRTAAILALGGINLVLIQWIMVRELTALLLGTELIALFVTGSAFVGYSLGYLLSNRLSERSLRIFALVTLPLHLSLPFAYRLIVGSLDQIGGYRIGFVLLLALTPFTVSAFYSLFLPRFANAGQVGLGTLYGIELIGTAIGVLLLPILGGRGLLALYIPYTLILGTILALLGIDRRWLALGGVAALVWLIALPALDAQSNAYVYRTVHNLSTVESLASVYSPYQKVDVLQDSDGRLYLYLNGLMDYGSDSLTRFNVILSGVPAQLIHPAQMAIVGSGSMASVALAAPHAGHITTVELDPTVADLSRHYFSAINQLDRVTNWTLAIDDAKHFFGSNEMRYDLITMDVPAPFTIQEGALHTAEFYGLLKRHLAARGVVSVSLSSTFTPTRTLAKQVVAGLLANFAQVIVVTSASADLSFAYASDDLPFDNLALEQTLRANNEAQFLIYQPPAVRQIVGDTLPIAEDDMRLIWQLSLSHVQRILNGQ